MTHLRLLAAVLVCHVATTAWAVDARVSESEQNRVKLIEKMAPAVVAIFSPGGAGGGSGVLVSRAGYAVTNFHVVSGSGAFMKCGLNNGVLYDCVVVGIDPTGDVALVKLLGRDDFPAAELGDSDKLQVGDWTYVMGNPFLLATDFRPTVTYGIVSGVHRYQYPAGTFLEYTDCIQVDTSINPGNSGGPLFNSQGQLVGINGRASFEKRGRVNVGAGYAISINQIKNFMDHLRSGRIVDHATLGATVATQLSDGSVQVDGILENSEAFRRGLREGDEIVSFAGRPIRSVNQFKNILGIYPSGWKLPLVYRREGHKQELFVRLTSLHRKSELTLEDRPPEGRPRRRIPGGEKPGGQPGPDRPHDGDKPDKQSPDDDQPHGDNPGSETPKPDKPNPDRQKQAQPKQNQPKPDQPGDGRPRGRRPNRPRPGDEEHARREAAPSIPEKYKQMFVKKEGFANYYFNGIEQERALRGLAALGDFSKAAGSWRVAGTSPAAGNFEFILTDEGVGLDWAGTPYFLTADQDAVDDPPGSGGLLVAMHHLRLFLTNRERAFGEFYYLGSEPLDGRGDRVDVVVTSANGVECRWYFNREDGTFVGFDTQVTSDADACEIRFAGFDAFQDRRLPSVLHVRHAAQDFATLRVQQVNFGPIGAKTKLEKEPPKADKQQPPKGEK